MTKKDFELIADAIKLAREYAAAHPEQNADVGVTITLTLSSALATTNPRFDSKRFQEACGLTP